MKFKITNTKETLMEDYGNILQEFNLKKVNSPDFVEYTIELHSLDDLKVLKKRVKHALIVNFFPKENDIEIYDEWRE